MSASALEWVPESLYNTAISTLVTRYTKFRREFKTLPENVQFDIYYKVSRSRKFIVHLTLHKNKMIDSNFRSLFNNSPLLLLGHTCNIGLGL